MVTGSVTSSNAVTITIADARIPLNISPTGSYSGTSMSGSVWAATQGKSATGTYVGTINSTVTPLTIPISVSATLTEDAATGIVSGQAVLTHSACFVNLNFSPVSTNYAVGGAFNVQDQSQQVFLTAVPSPTANNQFEVAMQ
jgi:hypothetical protein